MNILVRTDASVRIGTGHVMRCLTLAEGLRQAGAMVHFVCRELAGDLMAHIRQRGFPVHKLPRGSGALSPGLAYASWLEEHWETDAAQCEAVLQGIGKVAWLVVDHYALDARWESRLRSRASSILAIDDLADREHDCDLLLDQNLMSAAEQRYAHRVPGDCRLLLGPRYALLRPEFRELHERGARQPAQPVDRILVFLGGSDPEGLTLRVLGLLESALPAPLTVCAIIGAANPHRQQIQARFAGRVQFEIVDHSEQMAQLMAQAQLAVGAGGAATWERCCLGLPAVLVAIAANQVEVAQQVAAAGACLYAGSMREVSDASLLAYVSLLLESRWLRQALSEAGRALVDGRGCARVVREMSQPTLSVRPAVPGDALRVFPWRNAEATRRSFHDPGPLTLDGHIAWFNRTLADPDRVLLIGESAAGPIGVLRYDLSGSAAMVSVYLDPALQGRGYGSALLLAGERWLRDQHASLATLRAEIRAGNTASRSAFARAGFTERCAIVEKRLQATCGTVTG